MATLQAQELKDAALLAKRHQDEFLAMLAHELRNPLAPIRSAVALLERLDAVHPTLSLIREVVGRQVEHMARLLDDLLDASRVTSGKVTLQRRPTRVNDFVDQAVEISRGHIDAQHHQLSLDMPVTPLYVDGDPTRLAQIIGNLLHNAAKYTPEGGVISVSARGVGDKVVIRVIDNGSGISAETLPNIFDLFRQEDRTLNRSQGGLGIGLTIVRSMVELHGGNVEARSAGLGQGSEFIVTIPRVDGPISVRVEPRLTTTAAPSRILLVDDNADAGTLLAMLLRMSGHEVEIALDGLSALEMYDQQRPQVLLCDIGLPGLNGYEVASRIRARNDTPATVLIALTGYDGPADRSRALAAGFNYHVAKPVDFDDLVALINSSQGNDRS
ncbi:ATP-binding protein [Variovorax sp. J22R133]|uniref:hybrid sensor histidine kinase/response regulator n=1 Tax=Variovorax brevis TaxID=3053503 RepID=UPI0025783D4F|nr:ATP-binding protein [Variovorax sp. J22R133]MDM0117646.1 ATP-binding protein [Variovorax sp. J22R133]